MDSWVSLVPLQPTLEPPEVTIIPVVDQFVAPYLPYILLVLVLLNLVARAREYGQHRDQADEGGADALTRNTVRLATNVLLVVGAAYYATVSYEAGIVLSVLVIGMVISDLFEFEARKVEARREIPIERPNGAIAASVLVLLYVAYNSLFFLVAPLWEVVVG